MRRIQFGFCMPDTFRKERRGAHLADLNRALEMIAGRFDSAWSVDHLQSGEKNMLEGFTALAYLSALHPQLKFGHAVLCQSFRNPALLAKMAATLQFMSGGRYVLGIGAGWNQEEYEAYGYTFPSDGARVEQLEEAIQIIKAMWSEEKPTFRGKYYSVVEAQCNPRPHLIPTLMIGAFRPKMLRLVAKYADCWNVSSTGIGSYRQMSEELERACHEVGRDPSTVRRSWIGGCACAPTQAEAEAMTEGRWVADDEDDFDFVGTPNQLIDQMRLFIEAGVDYFMLDCADFPRLTTLELLIGEVLPALNEQE